jgi:hypothetical protein
MLNVLQKSPKNMISRDNQVMSNYGDFLEQTDPDIWTFSGAGAGRRTLFSDGGREGLGEEEGKELAASAALIGQRRISLQHLPIDYSLCSFMS